VRRVDKERDNVAMYDYIKTLFRKKSSQPDELPSDPVSTTDAKSNPKVVPYKSKEELEQIKLGLEISELRRSSWTKPGIVIPIIVGLVTLGLSQYLGVFDVERKRVELQAKETEMKRNKLQDELTVLEAKRTVVEKEQKALEERKVGLGREIDKLQDNLKTVTAQANNARRELDTAKKVLAAPNLAIGSQVLDLAKQAEFYLINRGQGLAKIQVTRFYVDGKLMEEGPPNAALGPTLNALGINEVWVRWQLPDSLKGQDKMALLSIEKEEFDSSRATRFKQAINRLGIEVCYCSVFKDCYWATLGRPPINKRACEP
jgi:hypothetical protein